MTGPAAATLPASSDDLSAEWLTLALREGGHLRDDDSIDDAVVEPVGAPGTAGSTVRVRLTGRASDLPSSLIAKMPDSHPDVRRATHLAGWYTTEIRFYEDLAERCGWRTPRCFFAQHNQDDGRSVLLLEDLEAATIGEPAEGIYPDEADRLMRRLAGHHARWWGNDELSRLDWLRLHGPERSIARGAEQAWRELRDDFRGQLSPAATDVMDDPAAVDYLEALITKWELISARMADGVGTLVHGDYGRRNLAVDGDASDPYVEFDFQFAAWGRPSWDLAQFTYSSTLRESEEGFARRLDENIRSYIDALGSAGIRDYSADDLRDDSRWHSAGMSLVLLLVYWATFKRGRRQPSPMAHFWSQMVRRAQTSGIAREVVELA